MVYYAIALTLYRDVSCREVLRCLLEGVKWLLLTRRPADAAAVRTAGKSGISQARTRLGWEAMKRLHDEVVAPVASAASKGASYRRWRPVSMDGSTLDVADSPGNVAAFGRPKASRGASAFPQVRLVSLVENGTRVLFGTQLGNCRDSEIALARDVLPALKPGMLCLADRLFFSHPLWSRALATRSDLLWRVKRNLKLPREQQFPDGSFLTTIFPSDKDRRHATNAIRVRAIEYRLEGVADAEPLYRLITSILDPERAPAQELAALYHERWEIETALDELKTHLRGPGIVLRSKTPDLVRQEFWGMMLAHFAIRNLMHEAALQAAEDPDRLSFLHAVRVVRRKLAEFGAFPPSEEESAS